MAWGDSSKFSEDEPLWSLVKESSGSTTITLMAETRTARDERHSGKEPSDRKETVVDLDEDLNRFINQNRRDCRHEELLALIQVVSVESVALEARKIRAQKTTSSIL